MTFAPVLAPLFERVVIDRQSLNVNLLIYPPFMPIPILFFHVTA